MSKAPVTRPLIHCGARYTVELARCILFGVLLSAASATAFFLLATRGGAMHRGLVLLLSALVFPLLYALAGHQRGIGRALASLTRSHGGLLYDHTLGRFFETVEARRPGAFAAAMASPTRLVQQFRLYLHEQPAMPRTVRRVAVRYVSRLVQRLGENGLPADQLLDDGRVNPAALRHWAIQRMHDQFLPSWQGFGLVCGLQVLATGALVWASR